jgi:hypothetical protein
MSSYQELFGHTSVPVDERDHIGPHHLSIGKSRKLFEHDGVIHAFYSRGYEIAHTRLCAETMTVCGTDALDLPSSWGGGAFCIDDHDEAVTLVFLHRNQHEFCIVNGWIEDKIIRWGRWRPLLVSRARQSAPWVSVGPDGTAWASVLDRDGDFRLVAVSPDGTFRVGDLFETGEAPWYHSCIQVLPVQRDRAIAIGFRGEFPSKTELVFKSVSAALALGQTQPLAPCVVNDKLTFHFQAVGDPQRGRAHVVYLDEGLSVSHAYFENDGWHVARTILPGPCFAPQLCLDEDGNAVLLAADYEGVLWRAAWSDGWSPPRQIRGVQAPNVSALFGQTGFGTGGLITAARAVEGRVPFLFGTIDDDRVGRATLHAAVIGGGSGLLFDAERPLTVKVGSDTVEADIGLSALRDDDLRRQGWCWLVTVPAEAGRAVKLELTAGAGTIAGRAYWQERDGRINTEAAPPRVEAHLHDVFSKAKNSASIHVQAQVPHGTHQLRPEQAWVETYSGWPDRSARLCDLAPYSPETTAMMALEPNRIPRVFKRMV